jgi:hypothetical protein
VTSAASLALSAVDFKSENRNRAVEWICGQLRPDFTPLERFLMHWRGTPRTEEISGGSPWFPNTAAWIAPTVMSVLALSQAINGDNSTKIRTQVNRGKRYILSRRCEDGGWNHGGTKFRSQNAESYPEMTGMALLGLHGTPPAELDPSLAIAEKYLSSPGSLEGLSWLQLGLMRQGRDRRDLKTDLECRTVRGVSLRMLALADPSVNKLLNRAS